MVLSKTMLLKLKKYKLKIDKFIFVFAILILLQFLVISLFQSKLSYRNYDLNGPLNLIKSRCKNNKFALNYNYMNYFYFENYLFIAYQLLLAYLGLDALFKEYVMQIFVYFLMNIGGYVYLIIQMVEIVISIKYLRDECLTSALTHENDLLEKFRLNGNLTDPKIIEYDLPQFIIYTLFVIMAGYLSLLMYFRIGINHYFRKKIGNNELLVSSLKRQLILKLFLKDYTMGLVVLLFLFVFILVLRLARVTFIYIDEESNRGMTHSSYLWIFTLFNNIVLCIVGTLLISERWYFLLPYNLIYFGVSLTSYIYVLKVKEDFGKGLKEAKQSALNALNDNDENIIIVTLNEKQ
ncbi:hypothetical protein RhiirC2_775382 [Rhizophagus irregularis]|uniref:Uncharacterized protein n=1 Tax=Rhizophagus irregularis TaxID=588596 RepID=A0A2N1NJ62_9GLOM|nr:hypothetical protein RhiirC2_775382 [Rhizophagus irregularis]